jgi:hypothetical protein
MLCLAEKVRIVDGILFFHDNYVPRQLGSRIASPTNERSLLLSAIGPEQSTRGSAR